MDFSVLSNAVFLPLRYNEQQQCNDASWLCSLHMISPRFILHTSAAIFARRWQLSGKQGGKMKRPNEFTFYIKFYLAQAEKFPSFSSLASPF